MDQVEKWTDSDKNIAVSQILNFYTSHFNEQRSTILHPATSKMNETVQELVFRINKLNGLKKMIRQEIKSKGEVIRLLNAPGDTSFRKL